MGPNTLFDKSFLQGLSDAEAVIFDALYCAIIAPVFYAEVLANLAKEPENNVPPEKRVAALAEKTPVMHCYPTAFHTSVVAAELSSGYKVPMIGVPTRTGGRASRDSKGKINIIYGEAPESEASSRWQDGKFDEVEREFAADWRAQLATSDLAAAAKLIKSALGIVDEPKNLGDAYAIAERVVNADGQAFLTLLTVCQLLGIPAKHFGSVIRPRWVEAGRPKLVDFAPYAAYCLLIDIFFYVAVDKKLISPDRPSNRNDIAYLYYLPFCLIFVSDDKLHLRTANLFLRKDQQLVRGLDLKADLARLVEYYAALPKETLDEGIFLVADKPPADGDYLTTKLWAEARRLAAERTPQVLLPAPPGKPRERDPDWRSREKEIVQQLTTKREEALRAPQIFNGYEAPDSMTLQRMVPMHRGNWRLLPERLAKKGKERE